MKAQNEYPEQLRYNRTASILLLVVTVAITSFGMSLVMSVVNLGLPPNFLEIWARNYAIAFVAALPVALVAMKVAKKVAARLTA